MHLGMPNRRLVMISLFCRAMVIKDSQTAYLEAQGARGPSYSEKAQSECEEMIEMLSGIGISGPLGFGRKGRGFDSIEGSLIDAACAHLGVSRDEFIRKVSKEMLSGRERESREVQTEGVHDAAGEEGDRNGTDGAASAESLSKKAAKSAKKSQSLYRASAGGKAMAVENVIRLMHEAYEVKVIADVKDDGVKRPRQNFTDFMKNFLVRKYGLKSIANKNLGEVHVSPCSMSEPCLPEGITKWV